MVHSTGHSVNMSRIALLAALRANLALHKEAYAAAVDGFKDQMIAVLEENLIKAKEGKLEFLEIDLAKPEDHSKDYTNIIEMMECSVDETINLDSTSFRSYVKNEWYWSENFSASNAGYISASMSKLNRR